MGRYVSTYFSPGRGTDDVIIGFIDRCKSHLDVAIYSITHDDITEALIRAYARGVKVRVITDGLQSSGRYADDEKLQAVGIPLLKGMPSGLMHAKFAIDGIQAVGFGSFNWTASAEHRNVEHFSIVRLRYVVEEFQERFDSLWEQLSLL